MATLHTKATFDGNAVSVGVAKMRQEVGAFASGQLGRIGGMVGAAFTVGAMVRFTTHTLQAANAITTMSQTLGVSAEELQALDAHAVKFGGSAEKLHVALVKLRKEQGAALGGDKDALEKFRKAGISPQDLTGSTAQVAEKLGKAYDKTSGSAQSLAAMQSILGKSGRELTLAMQALGTEGLQTIIDKSKEAGLVMSNELVARLEETRIKLDELKRRAGVVGARALGAAMDVGPAGGTAAGAAGGALLGAKIGSILPGYGTAIGAGVGAILGGVGGFRTGKANEDAAAQVKEAMKLQAEFQRQQEIAGAIGMRDSAKQRAEAAQKQADFDRLDAAGKIASIEARILELRQQQAAVKPGQSVEAIEARLAEQRSALAEAERNAAGKMRMEGGKLVPGSGEAEGLKIQIAMLEDALKQAAAKEAQGYQMSAEIAGMEAKKAQLEKSDKPEAQPIRYDQLRRVGIFAAALAPGATNGTAEKQLKATEKVAEFAEKQVMNSERMIQILEDE